MNRSGKHPVVLPARGGPGNSDPMQLRQTMTPDSGNAAQLNYGRWETGDEGGEPCSTSPFRSGSLREAQEIEQATD